MKVRMALTKGRLEKQFIEYFQSLSYDINPLVNKGRKLLVSTEQIEFIFCKRCRCNNLCGAWNC